MESNGGSTLSQWIRYELAVIKIQRVFRQWRLHQPYKRMIRMRAMRTRGFKMSRNFDQSASCPTAAECIHAVIGQKADWSHQTAFWRIIVDTRRLFPNASTDLIVKALLESSGDVSRAHILLGTKEFCTQHKKPLPDSIKALLLPNLDRSVRSSHPTALLSMMDTKLFGKPGSHDNEMFNQWAESRRRNVDMVRSLRAQQKRKKRQEFMDQFSEVIDKCLFPREDNANGSNRPGSATGTRPKTPNKR